MGGAAASHSRFMTVAAATAAFEVGPASSILSPAPFATPVRDLLGQPYRD